MPPFVNKLMKRPLGKKKIKNSMSDFSSSFKTGINATLKSSHWGGEYINSPWYNLRRKKNDMQKNKAIHHSSGAVP